MGKKCIIIWKLMEWDSMKNLTARLVHTDIYEENIWTFAGALFLYLPFLGRWPRIDRLWWKHRGEKFRKSPAFLQNRFDFELALIYIVLSFVVLFLFSFFFSFVNGKRQFGLFSISRRINRNKNTGKWLHIKIAAILWWQNIERFKSYVDNVKGKREKKSNCSQNSITLPLISAKPRKYIFVSMAVLFLFVSWMRVCDKEYFLPHAFQFIRHFELLSNATGAIIS